MTDENSEEGEGGESACFAHLTCPECGAVFDGFQHARNCARVDREGIIDPIVDVEPEPID